MLRTKDLKIGRTYKLVSSNIRVLIIKPHHFSPDNDELYSKVIKGDQPGFCKYNGLIKTSTSLVYEAYWADVYIKFGR